MDGLASPDGGSWVNHHLVLYLAVTRRRLTYSPVTQPYNQLYGEIPLRTTHFCLLSLRCCPKAPNLIFNPQPGDGELSAVKT
jgi:hypothetical protein